jgi:hypothetical protein
MLNFIVFSGFIDLCIKGSLIGICSLEKAIPMLNNDIRSIPNLYYDKTTTHPAMVAVVRNEDKQKTKKAQHRKVKR